VADGDDRKDDGRDCNVSFGHGHFSLVPGIVASPHALPMSGR
jgi:hypothetical protein